MPNPGGYDREGNLTVNPWQILNSGRALPIGYWKGSGLAMVLDIMAALLSGGQSTHEIGRQPSEYAVSQVFIAIDATSLLGEQMRNETVGAIIRETKSATPLDATEEVRYPGEGMLRTRQESLASGVLVDERQWLELLAM